MNESSLPPPRRDTSDVDAFYSGLRENIRAEHPEVDLPSSELIFNLIRTFNVVQARLGHVAQPHGITMPGFNVLTLLNYRREGMPLNELGNLLLVSRANVTGLIDSLERKGLVERVDHKTDRRIFLARITTSGAKLLKGYRPAHLQCVKSMGGTLSGSERKILTQLLAKWRTGIESNPVRTSAQPAAF